MSDELLWEIMDTHLNTGDYLDDLDGYVRMEQDADGAYWITFEPSDGEARQWVLTEVTP